MYALHKIINFEFSFAGWTDYTVGHAEGEDKYYSINRNNKLGKIN